MLNIIDLYASCICLYNKPYLCERLFFLYSTITSTYHTPLPPHTSPNVLTPLSIPHIILYPQISPYLLTTLLICPHLTLFPQISPYLCNFTLSPHTSSHFPTLHLIFLTPSYLPRPHPNSSHLMLSHHTIQSILHKNTHIQSDCNPG